MTRRPWRDTIGKLRSLGYIITYDDGEIKYSYKGSGEPPEEQIVPLIEVLKIHKEEILKDPYFLNLLIEETYKEINEVVTPEILTWIEREQAHKWIEMAELIDKINWLVRENIEDANELSVALKRYKFFMIEMVEGYRTRDLIKIR